MTAPNEHLAGQLVETSRRTAQRAYFMRPGRDTCDLQGYLFGRAATKTGQVPHVACAMSNHIHMLHTDTTARRSDFLQWFISTTARKRNLQLNRRENLWAVGRPGDMVVLDMDAVVERVLYVLLQPVAAGCVERVNDWTGFMIRPRDWGTTMRFPRPAECNDDMPEFIEFTPQPPPGFEDKPLEEVIAFFEHLVAREEKRYAQERTRRVQGIRRCERMHPFHTPSTRAPMRTLNPSFTGNDKARIKRARRNKRAFQAEHRECSKQLRAGVRATVFPPGTLQMRIRVGVRCRPCSSDHPTLTDTTWTVKLRGEWDDWIATRAA